ncbi:MAG: Hint domain-containing protein [Pseudomonadota bacterium]
MPLTLAILTIGNANDPDQIILQGAAPSGGEFDNGSASVGATYSADIGAAVTFTITDDALIDDANAGGGSGDVGNLLSEEIVVDGVTYPAGSRIETDYSAVLQDAATGYYYVLSHVSIGNAAVGAIVSRPFDVSADSGQGAVVENVSYSGQELTLVQPDAISDSAPWEAFVQDATYNLAGSYSNDVDISEAWVGYQDPETLRDGIVSGTDGNDLIDGSYAGDPDGDRVDAGDAINGTTGDQDVIEAGAGDDTVIAGAEDDTVYGGAGDDQIDITNGNSAAFGSTAGNAGTPIGLWNFEVAADPTDDNARLDNDAILQNGATQVAGGIDLDGNNDYVEIPHDPAYDLTNATVRTTFTLDSLAGDRVGIFSRDSSGFDGGGHFTLWANDDGSLELRWQDTSQSYTITTATGIVTVGEEIDIHVSFDNAAQTIQIFADGTEVGSLDNVPVTLAGNQEPWVLGANQWTSGNAVANNLIEHMDGQISHFEIYDGAFTPAEIDAAQADQADIAYGGDDADTIAADGGDIVDGGAGGDDADTLVLENVFSFSDVAVDSNGNGWNGTVTFNDGSTLTFSEIETFIVDGEVANPGLDTDGDGVVDVNDVDDDNDGVLDIDEGFSQEIVELGSPLSALDNVSSGDLVFSGNGIDATLTFSANGLTPNGTGVSFREGEFGSLDGGPLKDGLLFDFNTIGGNPGELTARLGFSEPLDRFEISVGDIDGAALPAGEAATVIAYDGDGNVITPTAIVTGDRAILGDDNFVSPSGQDGNSANDEAFHTSTFIFEGDIAYVEIIAVENADSNLLFNVSGLRVSTNVDGTDTDGDGVLDHLDLDSDNDGISDLTESGLDASALDADNDGLVDGGVDGDGLTAASGGGAVPVDSDGDGVDDLRDLDSDGDGISDFIEAQGSAYLPGDGDLTDDDADGDGIVNIFDDNDGTSADFGGSFAAPVNTDGADTADYLDTDADNDGVLDINEGLTVTPGADANGDGIADNSGASYADPGGLVDGPTLTDGGLVNSDANAGVADYLSGNDGIVTGTSAGELIDASFAGDPDGDRIDRGDAILAGAAPDDDVVQAGGGNDEVRAGAGADEVFGQDGDDTLVGGIGNDTLDGDDAAAGDDELYGGSGNDELIGDGGEDLLSGGSEGDILFAGDGDDVLDGGTGDDRMFGEGGDDTFVLGDGFGRDDITGGEADENDGGDVIDASSATVDLSIEFLAPEEGVIETGDGDRAAFLEIEEVRTGSGDDFVDLTAHGDALSLETGAGEDEIVLSDGIQFVDAGDDADTITFAGAGHAIGDVIDGGTGGDDNDTLDLTGSALTGGRIEVSATDAADGTGSDGTVTYFNSDGSVAGTLSFTDIENVVPCFTPGTMIKTLDGDVPVELIAEGDRVLTRDNGFQVVRWVGIRTLPRAALAERPDFNPIEISRGALGQGLPERTMRVSPQHRMLIEGHGAQMFFGTDEVLVAAGHLTCVDGISRVEPESVTYIHLLFDRHEIVMADGAWAESFQPGDMSLAGMAQAARDEILALFPELAEAGAAARAFPAARMTVRAKEAPLLFI